MRMTDKYISNKMVSGALRDCINQHGPITLNLLSSASKRVTGNIKGMIKDDFISSLQKTLACDELLMVDKKTHIDLINSKDSCQKQIRYLVAKLKEYEIES